MIISKVEVSGIDYSKLPVLKEKEIRDLLFRLQHGDFECRETFIKGNTRLILSIIKRFNNHEKKAEDLFEVGCNGLMKSIDNFNLSMNVSFSMYAVPIIIGEIRKYLRDTNSIRLSRYLNDIAYRALQVRDSIVKEDKKEPTISQIAKKLEISREEVIFALDTLPHPVDLFEPVYHESKGAIYVKHKMSDIKKSNINRFEDILSKEELRNLDYREKLILNLRFISGRSLLEVASEIGISKDQVFRLQKTALRHMRKYV